MSKSEELKRLQAAKAKDNEKYCGLNASGVQP